MKIKKISINFPIDTYNELKNESILLGIPFSSLILLKLNDAKYLQKERHLLLTILTRSIYKN